MLKKTILFFVFGGGYFTISPAFAAENCRILEGDLRLSVPQLAIPADTPDGTVLFSSPKRNITLNCDPGVGYSGFGYAVNAVTTADFNTFSSQMNGVKSTLYIDGVPYDHQITRNLGYTSIGNNPVFRKNMTVWLEVVVDNTRGKIPISGSYLSGGFESIYFTLNNQYTHVGKISLFTPDITYIPCTMAISVSPDTIDFGAIKSGDLEKGLKFQRRFTTLIQKNKGCTIAVSAPFGINMYFEPTISTLNADGSLNLNNGLGLSIADTSGKYVPYNTAWKIDDVKVESVLKNNFTANLQKISGQDLKTGPFSADVVVRINYY